MSNIKLSGHTWDTSGIYDAEQEKTQNQINAQNAGAIKGMTDAMVTESMESYITDYVSYSYRASKHEEASGTLKIDTLIGGTIAWNQLLPFNTIYNYTDTYEGNNVKYDNGRYKVTVTTSPASNRNSWSIVPSTSANAVNFIAGHKYYRHFESTLPAYVGATFGNSSAIRTDDIVEIQTTGTLSYRGIILKDCPTGTYYINANVFDLTLMFGSDIADYIYSLEQANTGDGVAWFKSLFSNNYYAYNAGTLMSVQAARHETVGFNLWDEEWEIGGIDSSTGNNVVGQSTIRAKNFNSLLPGIRYYIYFGDSTGGANFQARFYDANKKYIGPNNSGGTVINKNSAFTPPANARYFRFQVQSGYGLAYKNDICFNINDTDKNGTYEPSSKHIYPLDSSLELRGVPKLDSNNKLYYDGDTYDSDGTVTRKYGIVNLGTLTWTKGNRNSADTGNIFYLSNASLNAKNNGIGVCAKYLLGDRSNGWEALALGEFILPSNYIVFCSSESDAAAFKTAMSGVYLVYELAAPTTESVSPYINPQIYNSYGTEEYVDAGVLANNRDVSIPVGHMTYYQIPATTQILKTKSLIAPVLNSMVADSALVANDFRIVDDTVYRITDSIASGAALVPGTNCTATTVAEILKLLLV